MARSKEQGVRSKELFVAKIGKEQGARVYLQQRLARSREQEVRSKEQGVICGKDWQGAQPGGERSQLGR